MELGFEAVGCGGVFAGDVGEEAPGGVEEGDAIGEGDGGVFELFVDGEDGAQALKGGPAGPAVEGLVLAAT